MDSQSISSQTIKVFLQTELARRCKANPSYSLRAFANLLEIESSALSKILSGKRAVSRATFKKIGNRLALSPQISKSFEKDLVKGRGRQKTVTNALRVSPTYSDLAEDHFQIVSEWYHFAILELVALSNFKPHEQWIAKTLGITLAETKAAVDRLQRANLLKIESDGSWSDLAQNITNIKVGRTSVALRKLQAELLNKAVNALEEVPLEGRDQSGMTMAIDSRRIPEAKKMVAEFRRHLCEFLQSGDHKDAVYQLGISLYPLSKKIK